MRELSVLAGSGQTTRSSKVTSAHPAHGSYCRCKSQLVLRHNSQLKACRSETSHLYSSTQFPAWVLSHNAHIHLVFHDAAKREETSQSNCDEKPLTASRGCRTTGCFLFTCFFFIWGCWGMLWRTAEQQGR